MLSVTRYRPADPASFREQAAEVLALLAGRGGYRSGRLVRSLDEPELFLLVVDWRSVGDYRRAWSDPAVKLVVLPFLLQCQDEPSAFEDALTAGPGEPVVAVHSDLAEPGATRG